MPSEVEEPTAKIASVGIATEPRFSTSVLTSKPDAYRQGAVKFVASNGGAIRGSGGAAKRTSILELVCRWCANGCGWWPMSPLLIGNVYYSNNFNLAFIAEPRWRNVVRWRCQVRQF